MSLARKLKPDRSITGALIPLSMLPIFGITSLIFGLPAGFLALMVMIGLFGLFYLYVFFRTLNGYLLVICADCAFLGLLLGVAYNQLINSINNNSLNPFEDKSFAVAYMSGLIFFGFVLVFLTLTRKLKWRGREIYELAAEDMDVSSNGYTSRPRPVGKVDYSPQEIRSFARFCSRHLIALPYFTSNNTTLVIIKNSEEFEHLLGLSGDYRDCSWVNFDNDGEISVHISQKDYMDYRQSLAFDQLCASLGQVFIDFIAQYSRGEGVRVIDRMDDLRISVLS